MGDLPWLLYRSVVRQVTVVVLRAHSGLPTDLPSGSVCSSSEDSFDSFISTSSSSSGGGNWSCREALFSLSLESSGLVSSFDELLSWELCVNSEEDDIEFPSYIELSQSIKSSFC